MSTRVKIIYLIIVIIMIRMQLNFTLCVHICMYEMCLYVYMCVCVYIYIYIWKVKVKPLSCVWFFATPWTVDDQGPPSMGFSRQEYWSGLPFPSPKLCCNNGITLASAIERCRFLKALIQNYIKWLYFKINGPKPELKEILHRSRTLCHVIG